MRWPLRYQIMVPMAAVMLLTVVGVGGYGAALAVRATKARIAQQIAGVVEIIEHSNFPLTDAVLQQMRVLSGAEIILVDEDGQIVSRSGLPRATADELAANRPPRGQPFDLGDRQWVRSHGYFHTVVQLPKRDRAEPMSIHVCYPEEEYRRAWQQAVFPPLAAIGLTLPLVVALAAVTASRISSRVGRLQRHVESIAEGNFRPLPLPERDDEIRALGDAVNRMAAMLDQYADRVRATERMRTLALLGGGIAHQLRNSATGCQIALDLHAEKCACRNDAESLQVAKRQLRLMEEYLQRFLQLGKRPEERSMARVDLAAIVDDALPLVQPAARHARLNLHWQCDERPCPLTGNVAMLTQLVINLLTNALEAAAQVQVESGNLACVAVQLSRSADRWLLAISDSGPGPADSVADRMFEPFVTGRADGIGLGLALAREIAEFHRGSIRCERTGRMTRFTVDLPSIDSHSRETHRAHTVSG